MGTKFKMFTFFVVVLFLLLIFDYKYMIVCSRVCCLVGGDLGLRMFKSKWYSFFLNFVGV
jgi:hypothetical protein